MFMEEEFRSISRDSSVINFLIYRLNRRDYRGLHILQHSRISSREYYDVLSYIRNNLNDDNFEIPKGDQRTPSNNGFLLGDYPQYNGLVSHMSSLNHGNGSSANAIKKITFVNLSRMGYISRYKTSANGDTTMMLPNQTGKNISHLKLNEKAIQFTDIEINNQLEIDSHLNNSLVALMGGILDDMYTIISEKEYITQREFLYFFTWIGKEYQGDVFGIEQICQMIHEYRRMSNPEKLMIYNFLVTNSKGNLSKQNSDYWDFNNFKNETATLFRAFEQYSILTVQEIRNEKRLSLSLQSDNNRFTRIRRSGLNSEYNQIHQVERVPGFEYHHIVQIAYAYTEQELNLIDVVENLIQISGTLHNTLPNRSNAFTRIECEGDILSFVAPNGERISGEIGVDVIVNREQLSSMIAYNEQLNNMI